MKINRGEGASIRFLPEGDIDLEGKIKTFRNLLQCETFLSEKGPGDEKGRILGGSV